MIHTQEQLLKWLDESPAVRPCVKRALDLGGANIYGQKDGKWIVLVRNGQFRYRLEVVPSKHPDGYGKYVVTEDFGYGRA